jgi:hypothetical protein
MIRRLPVFALGFMAGVLLVTATSLFHDVHRGGPW